MKTRIAACLATAICLAASIAASAEEKRVPEIVIEAERPRSVSSAQEIRAQDYELRPHATTFEILNNVPGLVVAQHQGGGKAAQYLLRGFDSDHGTDFALFVDGVPVNLVTHGHGQGYADLNFLIPEIVDRSEVYKGPYFVELGDFATSGALQLITKDEVEENLVRLEGGSFETIRAVAVGFPNFGSGKTLLAGQAYFKDGPFENPENYAAYNVYGKYTLEPSPGSKLSVAADGYASDWDGSGQIPQREVFAGHLDRFGFVDPTEGGQTDRQNLNLRYGYTPGPEGEWAAQVYATRYRLRLHSNFTFFRDTGLRFIRDRDGRVRDTGEGPVEPGADYLPGDGIEQNDERFMVGARAAYTRNWVAASVPVQTRLGVETRNDDIDVSLSRQIRRRKFFTVNEVSVLESSASGFLSNQLFPTEWMRLELGVRGDTFFFDVHDHLPAQGPDPNFESVAIDGGDNDSIVSPKVNLILGPFRETTVYLNFGTGFHSNDARGVVRSKNDPHASPLAQALGYEVGVRSHLLDRLDVATALWLLDLDSELTFSGDGGDVDADELADGNFAPGPATRRWGVDFELRYAVTDWLFVDYDLAYANARFRVGGGAIPIAPDLLMNGGLRAELAEGLSAALRVRMVDNRPANEDRTVTARGYTVPDFLARYRWRNIEASVLVYNLTDADNNEAQFADTSCVRREIDALPGCVSKPSLTDPGEGIEDIHFTPGNPLGARGGVTVYF